MADEPKALAEHKGGVLAGRRLQPRKVAAYAHDAGFRDKDLFISIAVAGSESWLFTKAYNDNLDDQGKKKSRDVGIWEINIPASQIGTQAEEDLYDPKINAQRAFALWKTRGWQPWVAFNTGVYLHDTYLSWALLGVSNYFGEQFVAAATDLGQTPKIKVPFVSLTQLKKIYPSVVLG